MLISALQSNEPGRIGDIARAANQSDAAVAEQIETLIASGGVVAPGGDPTGLLYSAEGWARVAASARTGRGKDRASCRSREMMRWAGEGIAIQRSAPGAMPIGEL